jgi:WD40 repeat protein
MIAVGFGDGAVVLRDHKAQRLTEWQGAGTSAIRQLAFAPGGRLAIGHDAGARLVTFSHQASGALVPGGPGAGGFDLINQPLQSLAFSPGGDYLAACTENLGALRVWRIEPEGPPSVTIDDTGARAFLAGFTGNSRGLFFGDYDGGIAFRPVDPQGDEVPWTFPANRGKVQQLSASPSRRFLLFLDERRQARIWDLKERSCRRLRDTWSSGVFLDDDRLVLIPDSNSADLAGRLVVVDRDKLSRNPTFFERKSGRFSVPEPVAFERVVLSADGSRIAASADASKEPMVCVWETRTGKLTHWVTASRLEDAVVSLSFSSDARYLLAGGDAPVAQLWDLSAHEGDLGAPAVTFADPTVRRNVTCAAIRPGASGQVVTGHSGGEVHVWEWQGGEARLKVRQLVARAFAGSVKAVCFTSDGQHLAAAGDGTRIWLGAMDPEPRSINVLNAVRPHHYEEINALCAWRDLPVLVSGSDDTTIRFWDLKRGTLWGTFSAATRAAVPDTAMVQELDWVLFTPDGRYDAPPSATKLVQYRRHDRPLLLDQFERTHHAFRLSESLLAGEDPRLQREPDEPPPVSISVPPRADPATPQTRLTITVGARDAKELKDVRLYHNDVLIPCGWEERRARLGEDMSFDVVVRLAPKKNRFYAMCTREGAYDSCSKVVEVDYTGPSEPGRLHMLALGVGDYARRRLNFARRDAERLSEVLHNRGLDVAKEPGYVNVLRDTDVGREAVKSSFDRIAELVEDRPQDTVVVFLAGHTGVFRGQSFCLLLPTYPFPEEAPLLVAARDASESDEEIDPKFVLPYSVVAVNMARLKALNRLVIVDACQAEAIQLDPKVRAIQKWMEVASREVRTSYLMAARRGEPALEVDPLAHGLFTYALLRGMRAVPLAREPKQVKALNLPADADFNQDGVLSTAELDAYAKQVLPRLADVFPQIASVKRDAVGAARGPAAPDRRQELDQATRMQSAEVSFPLVPVTEGEGR